jgi:CDP-diacylglycerol--serine O-phosphatidyltransferase
LNIKRHIPNLLTLGNLLCGVFAIVAAFQLDFVLVAAFAAVSLLFDFMDGTAARLLKVSSPLGGQLDSLADVISFGVSPAITLYCYWQNEAMNATTTVFDTCFTGSVHFFEPYSIAFLIAAFAAYRLAVFNISEQQTDYFKGLPTPAFALACFALPLAAEQSLNLNTVLNQPVFIILFVMTGCVLMISSVRLFSLKLGSTNKVLNRARIALVILGIAFFIIFKFFGIILCLLTYLLLSLILQKQIQ